MFVSKKAVLYQVIEFSICLKIFVAVLSQTGKFVLHTQDSVLTGTYAVLNLGHAVGNKQRIYYFHLFFSTFSNANFPHSLT